MGKFILATPVRSVASLKQAFNTFLEVTVREGLGSSTRYFAAQRASGNTPLKWFGSLKPVGWYDKETPMDLLAYGPEALIMQSSRILRALPDAEPRSPSDVDTIAVQTIEAHIHKNPKSASMVPGTVLPVMRRRDVCSFPACAAARPAHTCSRCANSFYCSTDCQRSHWVAGHKAECRPPQPTPRADLAPPAHSDGNRCQTSLMFLADVYSAGRESGTFVPPDPAPIRMTSCA